MVPQDNPRWLAFFLNIFPQDPPRRRAFCWVIAFVSLAGVGTYLAYHSPITSPFWTCWDGEKAWIKDAIRVMIIGALAYFALVQMQVEPWEQAPADGGWFFLPQSRREYVLLGLLLLVPLAVLPYLIQSFVEGLSKITECKHLVHLVYTNFSRDIVLPYAPYFLYIYGLWMGLLFPVLLVFKRRFCRDITSKRVLINKLHEELPHDPPREDQLTSDAFERLLVAYQSYVVWLKEAAERYLFILVAFALGLLYEQVTTSRSTATSTALDFAKVLSWFLLGPALVSFVLWVAFGYQRTSKRLQHLLGVVAAALAGRKEPQGLFDRVVATRNSLIWERGPTEFVVSVVKSAGIAMPLVIALGGYVIDALSQGKWLSIFLPDSIMKVIKSLYGG